MFSRESVINTGSAQIRENVPRPTGIGANSPIAVQSGIRKKIVNVPCECKGLTITIFVDMASRHVPSL